MSLSAYGQRIPPGNQNEVSTELQPPFRNEEQKPTQIPIWRSKLENPEDTKNRFDIPSNAPTSFTFISGTSSSFKPIENESIKFLFGRDDQEKEVKYKITEPSTTIVFPTLLPKGKGNTVVFEDDAPKMVRFEDSSEKVVVVHAETPRPDEIIGWHMNQSTSVHYTRSYEVGSVKESTVATTLPDDYKNEVEETTRASIFVTQDPYVEVQGTSSEFFASSTELLNSEQTSSISFKDGSEVPTTVDDKEEPTTKYERTTWRHSTSPMAIYYEPEGTTYKEPVVPTSTDKTVLQESIIVHTDNSLRLDSNDYDTAYTREFDRGHLLEVLNGRGGNRLRRVLEQRNMTLEELLDHRERGSSQLHLAEVDKRLTEEENRLANLRMYTTTTRRPRDLASVEREVAMFENFPNFDLSHMRGVRLSAESDSLAESSDLSVLGFMSRVKPPPDFIKKSRSMSDFDNIATALPSRATKKNSRSQPVTPSSEPEVKESTQGLMDVLMEHTGNSDTNNEILHVDLSSESEYKTIDISDGHFSYVEALGVRSAIIASSVIGGLSILVFLCIFIACRWRQKSKNKMRYNNRLLFCKGRTPILQHDLCAPKESPVVMISRSKNGKLHTLDTRSRRNIQEYLWDHFKKTFH